MLQGLEPMLKQNNNLLEIFFDQALEQAQQLDQHANDHNQTVGPLHGLPITLKDQFHVNGVETTMAYVGWIDTFEGKRGTGKERNVNSELVRELLELGAVPIAKVSSYEAPIDCSDILSLKTSCPQTLWVSSPFSERKASINRHQSLRRPITTLSVIP